MSDYDFQVLKNERKSINGMSVMRWASLNLIKDGYIACSIPLEELKEGLDWLNEDTQEKQKET